MAAPVRSPWLAIDAATDRPAYARSLRRVHDAFHSGHEVAGHVRAVVEQSWARSDEAGIDPSESLAPMVMDEDAIADRWEHHPLYAVLPVLRDLLSDATTRAGHMLVISDARGVLLWIEGHQHVIEATENMHFVCGADWSEQGAGTNALGTAIAVDHPVQIFSAEHFSRIVHPWQCSGAPIHDPETGEIIGVVDLTGHLKTAHPHTLSLVSAAAGMAEAYLRSEQQRRTERLRELYCARIAGTAHPTALLNAHGRVIMSVPHGWVDGTLRIAPGGADVTLADGTSATAEPLGGGHVVWRQPPPSRNPAGPRTEALQLVFLGGRPQARTGDRRVTLGLRQAELLAVLALCPEGLTSEQLALALYGDRGKPVTIRAEVSRLRRVLGQTLQSRPYRLAAPIQIDFQDVERMLEAGQLARALERYTGQLLRQSEVPLIIEARQCLDGNVRNAILASADPELLAAWCAGPAGRDDQPAAELLLGLLPVDDERHPAARARAQRLRRPDDEPELPPAW
jgi:hypothetical protein